MGYVYRGSTFIVEAEEPPRDPRCGTDAGHQAHKRRGEDSCDPCTQAHRKVKREWDAARRAKRPPKPPRPPRIPSTRGNAPIPNLHDVWSAHAANA